MAYLCGLGSANQYGEPALIYERPVGSAAMYINSSALAEALLDSFSLYFSKDAVWASSQPVGAKPLKYYNGGTIT